MKTKKLYYPSTMFSGEVILSNEHFDTEKIKQYFKDKGEDAADCTKDDICNAIEELYGDDEICFFDDDKYTESDFATDDICWSEFERRTPSDIFKE